MLRALAGPTNNQSAAKPRDGLSAVGTKGSYLKDRRRPHLSPRRRLIHANAHGGRIGSAAPMCEV